MNKLLDSLVYRVNSDDSFMEALAFLGCLKPGWRPKSYSGVRMDLEPDTEIEKALKKAGWRIQTRGSGGCTTALFLTKGKDVLSATIQKGLFHLTLFSSTFAAQDKVTELSTLFTPFKSKNDEGDGVWVRFVYSGGNGVEERNNFIHCPSWSEVRGNYCGDTADAVASLMELQDPWSRGRLIIWHGDPGTGKTFAIRALMMAWRKQFVFKVITDPEKLAADPGYYFEVAGASRERPRRYMNRGPLRDTMDSDGVDDEEEEASAKRTLFILEDSADLIMPESRQSHYDKVGKLLNMTDGLFGQGRQDVFLITFNEEIDKIDSAFTRPGRCVANVKFNQFSPKESSAWCAKNGSSGKTFKEDRTIAELYAEHLSRPVVSSELASSTGIGLRHA